MFGSFVAARVCDLWFVGGEAWLLVNFCYDPFVILLMFPLRVD